MRETLLWSNRFFVRSWGLIVGLAGLDVLRDVAANAPAPANEKLIGLLAMPALASGASLPVFSAPSADAARIAEVRSLAAFETREYGYEESAAVVVTAVPGWYRLGLSRAGSYGWLT